MVCYMLWGKSCHQRHLWTILLKFLWLLVVVLTVELVPTDCTLHRGGIRHFYVQWIYYSCNTKSKLVNSNSLHCYNLETNVWATLPNKWKQWCLLLNYRTFWCNNLILFISIFPWNTQNIHTMNLSQSQIISESALKNR